MSRRAVAALLLLGAVAMFSDLTWRQRKAAREDREALGDRARYVDLGVVLQAVVADPAGEDLLPGKPKLRRAAAPIYAGGTWDRVGQKLLGTSQRWTGDRARIWFASPAQVEVVLHKDDVPLGQLVYGSERGGKTETLPMWHYWRWLEHIGERRSGGQTAPTQTRLDVFLESFQSRFDPTWYTYSSSKRIITLCDGSRIRLVSTHRQSEEQGSPIQGFGWSWAGMDEAQDSIKRFDDVEARGASARVVRGAARYKQTRTATVKDSADWRDARDRLLTSGLWVKRTLLGVQSPFVHSSFWEQKQQTMSAREYKRRVLAQDVGPERATYPAWDREHNLITVQDLGWQNVTEHELRPFGSNRALLAGHDPGTLVDVTLWGHAFVRIADIRGYERGTVKPFWVIRGELNTERNTTEHHISDLLRTVRTRYQLNLLTPQGRPNPSARQILVRADPAGNNDSRTDKTVYTQFANAGIHIKPAAYNATNDGHGRVPKNAGIELVNTLFCNAANERRLFVERLADGTPAAPELVRAIESSQRDTDGKAETQRKDEHDVSHWPAALRYMLWAIERPRLQVLNDSEARA